MPDKSVTQQKGARKRSSPSLCSPSGAINVWDKNSQDENSTGRIHSKAGGHGDVFSKRTRAGYPHLYITKHKRSTRNLQPESGQTYSSKRWVQEQHRWRHRNRYQTKSVPNVNAVHSSASCLTDPHVLSLVCQSHFPVALWPRSLKSSAHPVVKLDSLRRFTPMNLS